MVCEICDACDCYACQEPHDKVAHREYEELRKRLSKKVFPELHNAATPHPQSNTNQRRRVMAANEQASMTPSSTPISNCHQAPMHIGGDNTEGTHYYVCNECGKPCDPATPMSDDINLCKGCYCMTHTVEGKCGKCGADKGTTNEQDEELRLNVYSSIREAINKNFFKEYDGQAPESFAITATNEIMQMVAQHTKEAELKARIDECERAISAYNFLQEEVEQPTAELKIGNHYILDRLAELAAPQQSTSPDGSTEHGEQQ